jgi:CheY-like chemotaxis protein
LGADPERRVTGASGGDGAKLAGGAGARVLVVEDESLVAMMLADMLQEIGCTVIGPIGSRTGALRLLEDGHGVDLALLDVNLGGETAYDIADALSRRGVPFIFVSGYGASGLDPRYADAVILAKPFEPALLARMIGEVLDRPTEKIS